MIAHHAEFITQFPAKSIELQQFRHAGLEFIKGKQAPSKKDEEWHYTTARKFFETERLPAALKKHSLINHSPLNLIPDDVFTIVFINGHFSPELSEYELNHTEISDQMRVNYISESSKPLTMGTPERLSFFEALNWAYTAQGIELIVPQGVQVSKPIHVVSYVTDDEVETFPRLFIRLEDGAELSIIEDFCGYGKNYLQNSTCELELGKNSKLTYIRLQNDTSSAFNIGKTRIHMNEESYLESYSIMRGAKLSRHDLELVMKEKNAQASVWGLSFGVDDQHMDHMTQIIHEVGACTTNQKYKSILNDRSRSIFTGKVKILKDAQLAASSQMNNNLLLSGGAEANSRPQLEIYADDVKATHGSTVGQLNEEEIFYLQSRGIGRDKAQEVLSQGFAEEIFLQIKNITIRNFIKEIFYAKN